MLRGVSTHHNHEIQYLLHDLASPITAANIYLEMLEQDPSLKGKHTDQLQKLSNCLDSIQTIIINHQAASDSPHVDVSSCINNCIHNEFSPLLQQTDIALSTDISTSIDIPLAEDKLRRIFYNLLANAIQFLATRDYTQKDIYIKTYANKDKSNLEIKNTYLETTFPSIEQLAQKGYTRKEGHSGLGLSFCQGVLQEVGADLQVTYTPGYISFSIVV